VDCADGLDGGPFWRLRRSFCVAGDPVCRSTVATPSSLAQQWEHHGGARLGQRHGRGGRDGGEETDDPEGSTEPDRTLFHSNRS
jgi:hypothetical protein